MEIDDLFPVRKEPKPPDPLGRDALFFVVLIFLAILIAVLWFADPSHQPQGESRAEWPKAPSEKP